ncbi:MULTISPECIES: Hint domain-containing protein [Shimia]|uniref:Hint domain-containing protein n=1 Tax=Shimia TaxID=573139 RepID=UPI001FB33E53|nr:MULTISPECIES: Hint domain-containing protein [Shimia]MDV4145307.1 Hint domain-containing protein [Shimia sp. FJ5]
MFGWVTSGPDAVRSGRAKAQYEDPVLNGAGCGLIEGTTVATQDGWRAVETLRKGESLLTFDGGAQQVIAVIRDQIWGGIGVCPKHLWPLHVPQGVIGNGREMLVMPHQGVLIESDEILDQWGDPFAVIPAAALEVLDGVERQEPYGTVEVVLPIFEEDQMIFTDQGALSFCQAHWGVSVGYIPKHGAAHNYNMLPLTVAARLLEESYMPDNVDYGMA